MHGRRVGFRGSANGILVLDLQRMVDNSGGRIRCIPCDGVEGGCGGEMSASSRDGTACTDRKQSTKSPWNVPVVPSPTSQPGDVTTSCADNDRDVPSHCLICADPFSSSNPVVPSSSCGHIICCQLCFLQYVRGRIEQQLVFPWVTCPAPDCQDTLTLEDLIAGLCRAVWL